MSDAMRHDAVAILPCNDLTASERFYAQLGFRTTAAFPHEGYRILHDDRGASIHLTIAVPGWVEAGRNPFGLYLYRDDVVELAARLGHKAEDKPWRMTEFALSDPDGVLVRIGWPIEELA